MKPQDKKAIDAFLSAHPHHAREGETLDAAARRICDGAADALAAQMDDWGWDSDESEFEVVWPNGDLSRRPYLTDGEREWDIDPNCAYSAEELYAISHAYYMTHDGDLESVIVANLEAIFDPAKP